MNNGTQTSDCGKSTLSFIYLAYHRWCFGKDAFGVCLRVDWKKNWNVSPQNNLHNMLI